MWQVIGRSLRTAVCGFLDGRGNAEHSTGNKALRPLGRSARERDEHEQTMNALIAEEVERSADLFEDAITAQVDAAARAVRSGSDTSDAIDEVPIDEAYKEAYRVAALRFAGEVFNAIDRDQKDYTEEDFATWEAAIDSHIALEGGSQIKLIDGYTKEWVRSAVAYITREAVAEGLGTDEIAKRLRERWSELSRNRAMRIAQTEMNSAANFGSMQSAITKGMTHKIWITAGDGRVREAHRGVETTPIPIEQAFNNGLMYPSQPGGNAAEVINCRCQLAYTRL